MKAFFEGDTDLDDRETIASSNEGKDTEVPSLDLGKEQKSDENEDEQLYICPVYEGSPESAQSPVVFSVPMPAGPKGSNHWVQRRVAIYTSKH